MERQHFTTNDEDFNKAKDIAIEILPKIYDKSNGHFLVMLQALDLVQNSIQTEAVEQRKQYELEMAKQQEFKC